MIINTRTVKSIRDSRTGKYYSPAELDGWATRLTNIKTDAGKSAERKARNRALRAAYGGDSTSRSAFALQTENLRRDADNILAARVTGGSAVRGIQLQGKADSQAFRASAAQTAFAGGKTLLGSSNRRVSSSRPYSGRGATSF